MGKGELEGGKKNGCLRWPAAWQVCVGSQVKEVFPEKKGKQVLKDG
jgi:hypothetical protein